MFPYSTDIIYRRQGMSGCCATRGPSVRFGRRPPSSARDYIKASRRWWIALVFHSSPKSAVGLVNWKRNYSSPVGDPRLIFTSIELSGRIMRGRILVLLASLVALAVADEKYTRKYDDVNVDKILQNNRVLTNYIRCLMDEGPCTAEGRELRSK